MDITNAKSFTPRIFIEKGFIDIVCMSPSSFGISSVYKVTKPGVGIWVIKRVKKEFAVLYKAEMHILTQLRHDFLPTVFDIFEDEQALYIAMEFIPGQSLQQIIGGDTIVSEADARKYFVQLCELFEYLHSMGVVHKDCKPSNIMLSSNRNVYLIDFGISKSEEYNPLGRSHRYASPEQADKPDISDPRTDIYSLGATMYSLLTKQTPNKNKPKAVAENLLERTDVSAKFKKIIEKCMAQNPDDRFQTMAEVKAALLKRDWLWKVAASFAFILVCTTVMFFGFTQWQEEATERLIPRGNDMMNVSNYQTAISHYETYIRRRPWAPYGYERRRNLLLHRGQITQSLELLEGEYALFYYFLETSPEFYNTWVRAVDMAVRYHYNREDWHTLLALLRAARVIPPLENAYMQMRVYTHMGDLQAALAVGYNYNSPFLDSVYAIIAGDYMSRAYGHFNNNEFRTTVNLINSALQQYPRLYTNFYLLNLRAVAMLSQLLLERSDDFTLFINYAHDAIAAAGPENAASVAELNARLRALQ